MRVTENRLLNSGVEASARARRSLFEAAEELSSGRRVKNASDDPAAWARGQRLAASLADNRARTDVQLAARERMVETDLRLQEIGDALSQARELTVQLSNGTLGGADRQAAVDGLVALREGVLAAMNARDSAGRSLFAGTRTNADAFAPDGTYQGDNRGVYITREPGSTLRSNVTGDELVTAASGGPLQVLDGLVIAAQADDVPALRSALDGLREVGDEVAGVRSELGSRMALTEEATEIRRAQRLNLETNLALALGADDIDAAERFARARSALEASQALSASLASMLRR